MTEICGIVLLCGNYLLKLAVCLRRWVHFQDHTLRKEVFKSGLLEKVITLHSKTSALVDDYRFQSAEFCRVAAPAEASGARFLSGSRFGDLWSCTDSVSPGWRRQAGGLACCVLAHCAPTTRCLHPRHVWIRRSLRSAVLQTAARFQQCQMESPVRISYPSSLTFLCLIRAAAFRPHLTRDSALSGELHFRFGGRIY
jgi:hypothetical protein